MGFFSILELYLKLLSPSAFSLRHLTFRGLQKLKPHLLAESRLFQRSLARWKYLLRALKQTDQGLLFKDSLQVYRHACSWELIWDYSTKVASLLSTAKGESEFITLFPKSVLLSQTWKYLNYSGPGAENVITWFSPSCSLAKAPVLAPSLPGVLCCYWPARKARETSLCVLKRKLSRTTLHSWLYPATNFRLRKKERL